MQEPRWIKAAALDALPPGDRAIVRHDDEKLLLFRAQNGRVFAVEARCPHQGYPLVRGEMKDCVLTCAWHNWKFDLADAGRSVLGGEGVRLYPTRVVAGQVEVDVAPPDYAARRPRLRESLRDALHRRRLGQALRDGVRLLRAGVAPEDLLVELARYDARRAEYGSTHALALAADCQRLLRHFTGLERMHAVAPVIELLTESLMRLPERAVPAALDPADAPAEQLVAWVEAEDAERAEGLVRGALLAGRPPETVAGWLCDVTAQHFTDFGHQAIYLTKALELLARAPADAATAADLFGALTCSVTLGTREDTLPYWRVYDTWTADRRASLPDLWATCREGGAVQDPAALRAAVLDGRAAEAMAAVWSALEGGAHPSAVASCLIGAAARRLGRFDVSIDADPGVAETWLWITHRFTHACAVHALTRDVRRPSVLLHLLHAAAFIHSGRRMDASPDVLAAQRLDPAVVEAPTLDALTAAIRALDAPRAVATLRAWLAREAPLEALIERLERLSLEDRHVRPIVVAHAIKTTLAATEHLERFDRHEREVSLVAVTRLLASPIVERRVQQSVTTSIRWVAHGETPRKLTQ